MKRILIIALLFSTLSLHAQDNTRYWYLIPRTGLTLSNLYGDNVDSKMRPGWQVGVEADAEVTDNLGFRMGAHFASIGGKDAADVEYQNVYGQVKPVKKYGERADWVMNYLYIPLQVEWKPVKRLSLIAGFQFAIRLNAHNVGSTMQDDNSGRGSYNFYASIPLGASVDIGHFVVDARYNLGLSALSDNNGQRLDAISLTLGYRLKMGAFKNKKPESKFHLPEIGH